MFINPLERFDMNDHSPMNYITMGSVKGIPVFWRNDATGRLPAAMKAFYANNPSPAELELVIDYVGYVIHAPCWVTNWADHSEEPYSQEINELREKSKSLKTIEDVKLFIIDCLKFGIDPI